MVQKFPIDTLQKNLKLEKQAIHAQGEPAK